MPIQINELIVTISANTNQESSATPSTLSNETVEATAVLVSNIIAAKNER